MERDEIRGLLLKFRNLLFFFRQPLKLQLKAKLGLVWDLLEENTAKHANSALDVCLRVEVTSCASPSHPSPLFPIVAWSGIPVLSHQQGLMVVSLLCVVPPGCSIKGLEQAVPLPCKPHFQGIPESRGWCESDHRERIPSLSLDPFFFSYITVLYLLLIAYGKARRREEEKKGTSLQGRKERRYCERVLSLAGGTAILWDVGFPAPRAALQLCHSEWGLLQERLCLGWRMASGSSCCTEQQCLVGRAVSPLSSTRTLLIINQVQRQASRV